MATSGRLVDNQREWRVNGTLTYKFTAEKLRGLSVGGGGRWRSPPSLGYKLKTLASGQEVLDLERKYRGPEELNLDGFASYRLRSARLLRLKTDWRLQLNIRNLLGEEGYVPTQAKTDGTTMVYTYKAPRQFIFSVETEF
jgi:outer membrane receptor protein involved in Fe transport